MSDDRSLRKALESSELLEHLADAEHRRWAHWQQYLHDQCEPRADGSLVIPAHLVERWTTQIKTPYADLSPDEQESDKDQVRQYLPFIIEAVGP
ncbi:hypothetical protein [Rathayibacter tanaceti]|uniref:Uncharacterized protein n=2 Tax=Rathayibacter tanaceti TaxID=1671680 RepID=A0A162GNT8_9MICO|nr:hypothetical protein [Rathayibacter tanaceti]KZX20528.1 hypothetical protein ACH61_02354 [Rathayibacter tanaceti]QHC54515.1 hypothetical protein GSU10_01795 [Rathayibacter tanaceti]TCO32949.1 hypothetical protein EV639_1164 [Rathayibacter tanaceti]